MVVFRSGQLWTVVDSGGQMMPNWDRYGQLSVVVESYGQLWTVVDRVGRFETVLDIASPQDGNRNGINVSDMERQILSKYRQFWTFPTWNTSF